MATPRPGGPVAHFDRPADVAAHVASHAAVVVSAPDASHAAQFAVAIAKAARTERRVALGDLAGDLAPIYALAGGEDAPGLADCFREGLALTEVARQVPDAPGLFVLPSGARVRTEAALADVDRWTRLIGGFGEAGGQLILVVADTSALLPTLAQAGAVMLYAGPGETAPSTPPAPPLVATVGARLHAPPSRAPAGVKGWQVALAAVAVAFVVGAAAIALTRRANAPDGVVVIAPPHPKGAGAANTASARATAPDTVTLRERLPAGDSARAATFAVEVVAANTASNANSLLSDDLRGGPLPAATIAVVSVRSGAQRAVRSHRVIFGAWREAAAADSALGALRRAGKVGRQEGAVVRAPYAVLLADSVPRERTAAVLDVWRAKGFVPYALTQGDGWSRVYAGAFETVAQGTTMTAMVRAAGGSPIMAYRTGRPD